MLATGSASLAAAPFISPTMEIRNQSHHRSKRPVPVLEDDTIETLAARVFREECKATVSEAIKLYAEGTV